MSSSASFDPSQDADPLINQTLGGKYTIERLIGRGGMGHVYLATETGSKRQVVVKMITPTLALQPQAMARFEREGKRLDGLRHSNIVEMYDYGRESGRAYIVMEYVDGELLSDFMARKGALSLAEFVPIAAQILKGVGHAHSRDLMIRDIKPSNVMLCERKGRANFVKIIDFGLAKMLEGDEDITKQHFVGTAGYLSPEQIKGLELDLRVDVYALGVLFYQMLSGRLPFEAENDTALLYKHVHEFPAPLGELLPAGHEVPEELIHLVHDCLEKDPQQRPRDANEIVEKLIDCVPMAMFKLPAAQRSPSASNTGEIPISALSTTALTAPTGETNIYLQREKVLSGGPIEATPASSTSGLPLSTTSGERPSTPASSSYALAAEPAPKRRTGLLVVGLAALLAIGVGVAIMMSGKDDPAGKAGASAELQQAIEKAEGQVEAGELDAAVATLKPIRGALAEQPELANRVATLDEQIKAGRLLATAKALDEQGKLDAALSAYRDALEADPANAELRARIAELEAKGEPAPDVAAAAVEVSISSDPVGILTIDGVEKGNTPFSGPLSPGSHEVTIKAEGYEDHAQTIQIESGENDPISVKLAKQSGEDSPEKSDKPRKHYGTKPGTTTTPTPPTEPPKEDKKEDPFLPTSKGSKNDGPFLPTKK